MKRQLCTNLFTRGDLRYVIGLFPKSPPPQPIAALDFLLSAKAAAFIRGENIRELIFKFHPEIKSLFSTNNLDLIVIATFKFSSKIQKLTLNLLK